MASEREIGDGIQQLLTLVGRVEGDGKMIAGKMIEI